MLHTQHHKSFSRKTLSIALAASVAAGGITVAAPSASAIGGYTPDEVMPNSPYKDNYATWGLQGGYVQGVPVKDGKVNGFSSGTGLNALSMITIDDEREGYYSDPIALDSMELSDSGYSTDVVTSATLSMDLKKVIYAIALINNDIVENNGLSQDVKDLFAHVGYKPTNTSNGYIGMFGENYGLTHTHKKSPELIESLKENDGDMVPYATQADAVAGASSNLFTQILYYGTDWTGVEDLENPKDPTALTLEQFCDQPYVSELLSASTSESVARAFGLAPSGEEEQKATDAAALYNALIDISKLVPDEAVKSDSVMLRSYVPIEGSGDEFDVTNDRQLPWLIDFAASDVPSVTTLLPGAETPEPETPKPGIEDSLIDKVRDNEDGTYTLIRKDGSEVTGTIDTSGNVSGVKSDGKGNLIVTIDGKDQTVPLTHVTVTEENKGTPNHTVTISTPDGKTVSFNVYDKHITDVTQLDNGNYKVVRNDGSEWVINLKDIRDKITSLEEKESPTKSEFDKVKKELAALNDQIDKELAGTDEDLSTIKSDITALRDDISGLEKRVTSLESRVTTVEGSVIDKVRDNGDGTYTLIRKDGSEVTGTIDGSGNVTKVASDGKGNLVVTIDGKKQTIPLTQVTVAEKSKGTPDHTITITTPDGQTVTFNAFDTYVESIEKQDNGNYIVTRNDGTEWTINLADLNKRIKALEDKDTVSPADLKAVQDELDKAKDDIDGLKGADDKANDEIDKLNKDVNDLNGRVDDLEARVDDLEDNSIKEVRDNGDGTYTIVREDESEVPGKIDTSGSITAIKSDGKGNLLVTVDGKDQTVPLDKVKVTEKNKGETNHTITITTPDGKSVTFNAFDTYVENITKDKNGNYLVTRNDGTTWTIELKDIRDKIAELEKKESPSRADYAKIKDELDKVAKDVEGLKTADKKVKGDIANLRADITQLDNRLITIETRLTVVENHTNALTKCVVGAGTATIPAMVAIPLMMLTQLNIPGVQHLNTSIQKQIGIYNSDLARQWKDNGGVLQAGAIMAGLAGIIGGITYLAKQCDPLMKTPAGQDTDLGKLSSKIDDAKADDDAEATDK